MGISNQPPISGLSETVDRLLNEFVDQAKKAFNNDLVSVVLYGSAAEKRLRPTSDVNLIIILSQFDSAKADLVREPLRVSHAAIKLNVMFMLEQEITEAMESFAVKFSDIIHRRLILYGKDVFANLSVNKESALMRLKQALLNLILRFRSSYVMRSLREEQISLLIAEMAGPLRACAATLLELEGEKFSSPKEALEKVALSLDPQEFKQTLLNISTARENRFLPSGIARLTYLQMLKLADQMLSRAKKVGK